MSRNILGNFPNFRFGNVFSDCFGHFRHYRNQPCRASCNVHFRFESLEQKEEPSKSFRLLITTAFIWLLKKWKSHFLMWSTWIDPRFFKRNGCSSSQKEFVALTVGLCPVHTVRGFVWPFVLLSIRRFVWLLYLAVCSTLRTLLRLATRTLPGHSKNSTRSILNK